MTTAKPSARITSSFFTNWTSTLDQSIFTLLYSVENHPYSLYLEEDLEVSPFSLRSFVDVTMNDFRHVLGKELPGFSTYKQTVIIANEQFETMTGLFHESGPPIEDILEDREAIDPEGEKERKSTKDIKTKTVFLYSSHNRESFLPHLPKETNPDRAYHKEVNITKVTERLASQLEERGIGALYDKTDITSILHEKGWTYAKSYDASRPIVQEALAKHDSLRYVFDIHRDSLPYDKTSFKSDGKTYASFLFVVGAEHKHYEKNLKLATELHHKLEERLPGISRGVITKEGPNSNGIYNQDLLENAVLIEVGGYDNDLKEMYRSIDLFAEVVADLVMDAEKVNN